MTVKELINQLGDNFRALRRNPYGDKYFFCELHIGENLCITSEFATPEEALEHALSVTREGMEKQQII